MSTMSTSSHMAPFFRGEMPPEGAGPKVYGGYGQGVTDEQRAVAGVVGRGAGMRVRCVETGEVFASLTDAAEALGVTPAAVCRQVKRNAKRCGLTVVMMDAVERGAR